MTTPSGSDLPDDRLTQSDLDQLDHVSETTSGGDVQSRADVENSRWHQDLLSRAQSTYGGVHDDFLGWLSANASELLRDLADAFFPNISSGEGALADIEDGQNEVRLNLGRLSGYCNLTMSHNWQTGDGLFQEYTPWTALPFDTYIGGNVNAYHGYPFNDGRGNGQRHAIVFDAPGTWIIGAQVTVGGGNVSEGYSEVQLTVIRSRPGRVETYSSSRFSIRHDNDFHSYYVQKPVMIPDDFQDEWQFYYVMCEIRHRNVIWWPTWGGSLWSSFSVFRLDKKTDRDQPADSVSDGGKYH